MGATDMKPTLHIVQTDSQREIWQATVNLRFKNEGGKRVLQQEWVCEIEYDAGSPDGKWQRLNGGHRNEWRNVPMEK
jgi:hypothetical protein